MRRRRQQLQRTDRREPRPPVGQACGSDVGECKKGTNVCNNGTIQCNGGQGPVTELCNGKDDDCDGTIDNGIPLGGACTPTYDTNAYPGDRTKGECKPGVTACDGNGGQICNGGVGPSPEVCDGKDNDCDGQIDEPGAAPDGINGTEDPLQPGVKIGDPCGVDKGECKQGQWACDKGKFTCAGGKGPSPEICDCADNDCDGIVDNENGSSGPPLCSPGKTCVEVQAGACQCAEPCGTGEFPCPTGSQCKQVNKSGTQQTAGDFCVSDNCGDCSKKTVNDPSTNQPLCGPSGSVGNLPECLCKGNKCVHPCEGVTCPDGQDCALQGPSAGSCQPTGNCFFFGCPDGKLCNAGACVTDPCSPNPCKADEVCKPNATFDAPRCVGTCASVTCQAGEICIEGQCTATGCSGDCPPGQYCQNDGNGNFACGPSKCDNDGGPPCSNGSVCDPTTGACGNDPCEGVACPAAQQCVDGECLWAPEAGTGGTGGGSGTGGSGNVDGGGAVDGGGGSGASTSTGGGGTAEPEKGVWGLATGGGGCACRTSPPRRVPPTLIALLGAAVALAAGRRRRRQREKRIVSMFEGDRS
ncbi:MAG: MopE-related protein [Polyangiaceae bacterium]